MVDDIPSGQPEAIALQDCLLGRGEGDKDSTIVDMGKLRTVAYSWLADTSITTLVALRDQAEELLMNMKIVMTSTANMV